MADTAEARSDHDPHQIVRYGANALSTQFHPEFTAGHLAALIRRRESMLINEQREPGQMLHGLKETPHARDVLRRFVGLTIADIRFLVEEA